MSTNLRKAQKHMQRARELLNQSQLGFGVPATLKRKLEQDESSEIETNKQLQKKIESLIGEGNYKELKNMIDRGVHSSEFKEKEMTSIAKWTSPDLLMAHVIVKMHSTESLEKLQDMVDKKVNIDEFKEAVILELAQQSLSEMIYSSVRAKAEKLINLSSQDSVQKLESMILERGIFEDAVHELLISMSKNQRTEKSKKYPRQSGAVGDGIKLTHPNLWRQKLGLLKLVEHYKKIYDIEQRNKADRRRIREGFSDAFMGSDQYQSDDTESDNEPFTT